MKLFGREIEGIPKALVVLSAILLVSSGLCGISTAIEQSHHWSLWGPGLPNTLLGDTLTIVDLVSWAGFMPSAISLVVVLAMWPIAAVLIRLEMGFARSPKGGIQTLFGVTGEDAPPEVSSAEARRDDEETTR